MMTTQAIKTEYAYGIVAGVDYGSRVRVLMRSPTAFVFVAYGVHIALRTNSKRSESLCAKATRECLTRPEVQARLNSLFGDGAGDAILLALVKRGFGTVLLDGGGECLPLPAAEQRQESERAYEAVTPTREYVQEDANTCLQCDAPLRLATTRHWFASPNCSEKPPRTLEELQRLTNLPIVRVAGFSRSKPQEWWSYIEYFETWDGESYSSDDAFCSDKCAAQYGRRAAQQLAHLERGGLAPERKHTKTETVYRYDEAAEAERRRIIEK